VLAPLLGLARVVVEQVPGQDGEILRALAHARGHVQRLVASRVRMRTAPGLSFRHDRSIDKSFRVASILERIRREKAGADEEEGESGRPGFAATGARDEDE
jgi:ribosome-binding factor A